MKWLPALVLMVVMSNDPVEIARINGLKKEAERSFLDENYPAAINYYHTLIDSIGAQDNELYLNLAHAYYESGDSAQARTYYSQASTANQSDIKSIAYQQLGALAKDGQQLEESLNYLKASIKSDPQNTDARYDYELVKKLLKEQQQQEQQNQDQQNEDQEKQDQEEEKQEQEQDQENKEGEEEQQEQDQEQQNPDEEQQDKEGEEQEQEQEQEGEEQQEQEQDPKDMSTKEKLEEMNISEEKARMILEAMRNSEIQYLQQQKRKPTKRPETGKPDW